ncbi:MAG: uracil-DNA glycosylase [Chitinivibrionales bacterium]|nr:uracil-DNA glycosylase [Chitinivibrionales bacterium]
MKQCKWYSTCPIKRFNEKGLLDKSWPNRYCLNNGKQCVRYEMEECNIPHPDWMLPDGSLEKRLENE